MGKSPQRPLRIPDDVWYRAVAHAHEVGRPIGKVAADLLSAWTAGEIQLPELAETSPERTPA